MASERAQLLLDDLRRRVKRWENDLHHARRIVRELERELDDADPEASIEEETDEHHRAREAVGAI